MDRDLFLDLARRYPEHAERTTLYASDGDLPVHLSAQLHDAPRAGYYEPYTVAPGVDTVAVPDFDLNLLGHSYFARAEALLHDIYDLIRHGTAPAQRQRIIPTAHSGTAFWKLRRYGMEYWKVCLNCLFSAAGLGMHVELDFSLEVRLGAAAARASVSVPQLVERVLSDFLDEVADDPAQWVAVTRKQLPRVWAEEDFTD